jgi:hypothetical protein
MLNKKESRSRTLLKRTMLDVGTRSSIYDRRFGCEDWPNFYDFQKIIVKKLAVVHITICTLRAIGSISVNFRNQVRSGPTASNPSTDVGAPSSRLKGYLHFLHLSRVTIFQVANSISGSWGPASANPSATTSNFKRQHQSPVRMPRKPAEMRQPKSVTWRGTSSRIGGRGANIRGTRVQA